MGTEGEQLGPEGPSAQWEGAAAEAETAKGGELWGGTWSDNPPFLPACPQCCRVNPSACWHTHCAPRRRRYSDSGLPASASCGGSTPVRPKHPAEIPLGPRAWVCVWGGGNKVAKAGFSLPTAPHDFLGEVFVQESDLTPQLPASPVFRPGLAKALLWVAQGQRKRHQPPGSFCGLSAVFGFPQTAGPESRNSCPHPCCLNSARPPSGGPASARRQAEL